MDAEHTSHRKLRIVLVEDDEATRYLVGAWLSREGYSVEAFGDAEAALEGLRKAPCGVLVTDNNLPGMPGVELVRTAMGAGLLRPSQVVMVSALPPMADCAKLGIAVLRKPVDIHALTERIERVLIGAVEGELPPRSTVREAVHLRLYVSSGSAASARAQRAAWQFAARPGAEHVRLEIRDVAEHGAAAALDRVAFTPTLLRVDPAPTMRIIGDLRDEAVLIDAIAVWQAR